MTQDQGGTNPEKKGEFDYCLWAKVVVGIPALFVAGSATLLSMPDSELRFVAAVTVVVFLVAVARKIESLPGLQKKFGKK